MKIIIECFILWFTRIETIAEPCRRAGMRLCFGTAIRWIIICFWCAVSWRISWQQERRSRLWWLVDARRLLSPRFLGRRRWWQCWLSHECPCHVLLNQTTLGSGQHYQKSFECFGRDASPLTNRQQKSVSGGNDFVSRPVWPIIIDQPQRIYHVWKKWDRGHNLSAIMHI